MQLREYQVKLRDDIYRAWRDGSRAVCAVAPTGSGKTVLMGSITKDQATSPGVIVAHRTELVSQISLTLARFEIPHRIIAPQSTVSFLVRQHVRETGRRWHDERAPTTVAAVDTLNARHASLGQWFADQRWWMVDEAHHLLSGNKWGTAVERMPNAVGLGVTATPVRADRKSLHVKQGGIFDTMVVGPSMRDLIDRGMLCDYRIFAPPQSIDTEALKIGSTGDYSQPGLRQAAHESRIVGDVVDHYMRLAAGKRGITFTVDVEQSVEVAKRYSDAGVQAMAISAKTPDAVRQAAIDKFRRGVIMQLVNVDLFGEGFDVPAVEVVSMARPTMSYGLYVQQFGRALRILEGKPHGIIIDHVGNVKRHGLPDAPRQWKLLNEERGKKRATDENVIPVTTCLECMTVYERIHKACPYCGHERVPQSRSDIEHVDGDLVELDAETLAAMRAEVSRVDGDPVVPYGATPIVEASVKKRWKERQEAQATLRDAISTWAGQWHERGASDSEIRRRFYHRFGVDVLSAQSLGASDARDLTARIVSGS